MSENSKEVLRELVKLTEDNELAKAFLSGFANGLSVKAESGTEKEAAAQ